METIFADGETLKQSSLATRVCRRQSNDGEHDESVGDTSSLQVPPNWTSGRIWGRTGCTTNSTTNKFNCLTGDCATGQNECNGAGGIPPATLLELTLNGNEIDFYDAIKSLPRSAARVSRSRA
ncbi:unnamed protein product [Linum trigynum]|uniref:Uncharacterized protein n=1 Tax=Linum trigynum TaxID=586398 RepID=A0AAV2GIS4_9ROSI